MKRFLSAITLCCFVLLLTACGGSGPEATPTEIGDALVDGVDFSETLIPLEMAAAASLYGIDPENVTEAVAYVSSGATAEEISVWQADGKKAAEVVATQVEKRIADQTAAYATYRPEEVPKLEKYILKTDGDIVVLCVADDVANAEKVLQELGF